MTPIRGPLARLDRSRDELAKAWLVRLIERASLEEISELPTDQIARELPELISDIVEQVASTNGDPYDLTERQRQRAAALAGLRSGRDTSPAEVARDISALQAVLVRALREELAEKDPERFADAVERLADATGAVQAAAVEELVRTRSRELESQANTDPLTGLGNLRNLQTELAQMLEMQKRYGHPFGVLLMDIDGLKRVNDSQGHQAGDRLLMQVAMALSRSIRTVDVAARLGGDEFCVLAPEQEAASRRRARRAPRDRGGRRGVDPGRPARGAVDRRRLVPRARRRRRGTDRRGRPRDVPGQGGRGQRRGGRGRRADRAEVAEEARTARRSRLPALANCSNKGQLPPWQSSHLGVAPRGSTCTRRRRRIAHAAGRIGGGPEMHRMRDAGLPPLPGRPVPLVLRSTTPEVRATRSARGGFRSPRPASASRRPAWRGSAWCGCARSRWTARASGRRRRSASRRRASGGSRAGGR